MSNEEDAKDFCYRCNKPINKESKEYGYYNKKFRGISLYYHKTCWYKMFNRPPIPTNEELAEFMHDEYEKKAKEIGWTTQEKCQVAFNDLPERNKKVMLYMAERLIKEFIDIRSAL